MSASGNFKRLYRSDEDRVLAGVCGGLGEYFQIDPVIVRLAWIIALFMGGTGFLVYFIAWLIVPHKPYVN